MMATTPVPYCHFRGVVAPASLKLDGLYFHVHAPADFRGVVAPASLKLRAMKVEHQLGFRFPGRCCPGLIEAGSISAMLILLYQISGALLPRPH